MKEKIAWVTDTSAMLDDEFIEKYNMNVLPIVVIFEDGPLRETIDITLGEFYERLRKSLQLHNLSLENQLNYINV